MVEAERTRRPRRGSTIDGWLRPLGDPPPGVPVTLRLEGGVLHIAGESVGELGAWPLEELSAASGEDGAVLEVDGEELVLTCEDEAWEKIVVRRLTGRPWWWMLAPAIAGLLIAFGLFSALS